LFPADLHDPAESLTELSALVAYLDEIVFAVDTRARAAIPALLRDSFATHLPREVREELALFAAQLAGGFRAPINFLRFRFRMLQLAAGEESLASPQMELPLGRGAGVPSAYRAGEKHQILREAQDDNGCGMTAATG
jgi:hypothetical protein